jgi:hypothetical protein
MSVSVQVVHALLRTPRFVEIFLVENHRDFMRIETNLKHLETIGVLAVQQAVPRIARMRQFEEAGAVRRTTQAAILILNLGEASGSGA